MGIWFGDDGAAAEDLGPLGRGVTAQALRPDFEGGVQFLAVVLEVADQAAASDPQQQDLFLA